MNCAPFVYCLCKNLLLRGRAEHFANCSNCREEALAEIRADFEQDYFVSGSGSMRAYDSNCLFADPFASFCGVDRFKKNVGNLGSLTCVWSAGASE